MVLVHKSIHSKNLLETKTTGPEERRDDLVPGVAKRQRDVLPKQNFKESVEPPKELDWDDLAKRAKEAQTTEVRRKFGVPCQNCGYCPTCGRNNKPWRPWDAFPPVSPNICFGSEPIEIKGGVWY